MLNNVITASALGLALLTGTAAASPGEYEREEAYEYRGPVPYEVMDINRDGVVTPEEHAQVHRERHEYRAQKGYPMRNAAEPGSFDQIDRDGDGAISREELGNWQAQRMQQRGMGWDR